MFRQPGEVVELRAIGVSTISYRRKHIEAGYFDSEHVDQFAIEAERLSMSAEGVYYTLNPVDPDLLARLNNRVEVAEKDNTTSDRDIVGRRYLLLDVDPKRKRGISATEEEKAAAKQLFDEVIAYLKSLGWPDPILADSGNGFHAQWRIDLPADDGGLVERTLKALAQKFDTPKATVDTSVFNPSRIVKLYGTVARKGDGTAARPHRAAKLLSIPAALELVTGEQLAAVAATFVPAEPPKPKYQPPAPAATKRSIPRGGRGADPIKRARALLAKIEGAVEGNKGSNLTFGAACAMNRLGLSQEEALRLLMEEYNLKCQPPWPEADLRHKIDDAYRKHSHEHGSMVEEERAPDRPATIKIDGNASLPSEGTENRAELYRGRTREEDDDPHRLGRLFLAKEFSHPDCPTLVHHRGIFRSWTEADPRYVEYHDTEADLIGCIKDEFDRINKELINAIIDKCQKDGVKIPPFDEMPAARKVTTSITKNVMAVLKSESSLSARVDAPAWIGIDDPSTMTPALEILPAANGLVDLRTLSLTTSTPRFFSPVLLPYAFDPAAPIPRRWLAFLDDIWGDDPPSIREIRKWMGYMLSPDKSQEKALFIKGPRRSGKGTIGHVITAMLGTANVAAVNLKGLASRFGLWPLLDKAAAIIPDARFSSAGENSDVLVERLLSITSRDSVEVEGKYLKQVTAKIPARLMIFTNEIPNIRENSGALAGRFHPLLMRRSFFGKEKTNLANELVAEIPGILKWAIEGRNMLREDGKFIVPESAGPIVDGLMKMTSPITLFVEECCDIIPDDQRQGPNLTPKRDVFCAYIWWCKITNRKSVNDELFGRSLNAAFENITDARPQVDGRRITCYRGIKLDSEGQTMSRRGAEHLEPSPRYP